MLIALRQQQCAGERASEVSYKYAACLVVLLEHRKLWWPGKLLKPKWTEGKMKKRQRHKWINTVNDYRNVTDLRGRWRSLSCPEGRRVNYSFTNDQ